MIKRIFDIIFSFIGLVLLFPFILLIWLLACFDTSSNGIFLQSRIGQFGIPFTIYKFRTIQLNSNTVSAIGAVLRRLKLDELPQLLNVLQGTMSVVGPRPDIAGYYDVLVGENRLILNLKPGLTSLAALKYSNEEAILATHENPLGYNDTILFPDKVKLNLEYYYNRSFFGDLKIIWETVFVLFR
jgi:lipopolysaccharide/colanic/teichoic acid biosynthesis glycosyltransferase